MRNISVKVFTVPAITKNGTLYTDVYSFERSIGNASVILTSTAGSITITQQVSDDGNTFYDAYNSAGDVLGTVCTAQSAISGNGRWISYSPVYSKYMRFKIVEGNVAATTVTIKLLMGEELS